MLLQRASAGSGKTYKLAKTYIQLLIAERSVEEDKWRLIDAEKVGDRYRHILAVTFTNKATNEMKSRIVSELAELAYPTKNGGYIADFAGLNPAAADDTLYGPDGRPASETAIRASAREVLHRLLDDYGQFNVSTIDRFFLSVLRSMAWELHVGSDFNVEVDNKYMTRTSVDEAFASINFPDQEGNEKIAAPMEQWLYDQIAERQSRSERWNVFSSTIGPRPELQKMAERMEYEEYKQAMKTCADYFKEPATFQKFVKAVAAQKEKLRDLYQTALQRLNDFENATDPATWNALAAVIANVKAAGPGKVVDLKAKFESGRSCNVKTRTTRNLPFKGAKSAENQDENKLALFTAAADALYDWQKDVPYWNIITSRLAYFAIMPQIAAKLRQLRDEEGNFPLADLNQVLSTVINDSDTPFIYERYGTRLQHFLLDEFQDTSALQWSNFLPLLLNSDSEKHHNLIIGDAKQSIYRFRNADPEIIVKKVPGAKWAKLSILPDDVKANKSAYDAVNSNWRSSRHVVAFNNTLFSCLASWLDANGFPEIPSLYSGVVQTIQKASLPGYVCASFGEMDKSLQGILPVIASALERGYGYGDIAILVNSNADGEAAVNALLSKEIPVVSPEMLRLSSSRSVQLIINLLTLVASAYSDSDFDPEAKDEDGHTPPMDRGDFQSMVINYFYRAVREPDSTDAQRLSDVDLNAPMRMVRRMLAEMKTITLPTLVDELARRFLTPEQLHEDNRYLCALQDLVLDYTAGKPADIESFLHWWNERGCQLSIPEAKDESAVQVMTIHKSKGLEFPIVIIPKANWTLLPSFSEMLWAPCTGLEAHGIPAELIPPLLPVDSDKSMDDDASPFHGVYDRFKRLSLIDSLNKTYVALTRAVRELYICGKTTQNHNSTNINVMDAVYRALASYAGPSARDESGKLMDPAEITKDGGTFEYGQPTRREAADPRKEAAKERRQAEALRLDSYFPLGGASLPAMLSTAVEEEDFS